MLYSIFLIAQGKCSELQEARKLLEIVGAMLGSYTDIPTAEGLLSSLPFLQYSTALKLNEAIRKWSLQDILYIQDLCDWLQTAQSTGECGVRRDFGSSLLETCSTQHSWKWMEDSKDTLSSISTSEHYGLWIVYVWIMNLSVKKGIALKCLHFCKCKLIAC